jgi:cysteinyl-tRNA synthetase
MHGNMLLLNGRKMAKSDGNTITPQQLFSGESPHISKGYSPMVVRFFMLQSHYRSTLDLTDEALQAAEKGYRRLMEGNKLLQEMQHPGGGQASGLDEELRRMMEQVKVEMDDDFNTPKALAALFELVTKINSLKAGHLSLGEVSEETLQRLKQTFHDYIYEVLGLKDESAASGSEDSGTLEGLMDLIIEIRQEARARKDFDTSDKIRDALKELDIVLKDGKEGTTWAKA